MIKLITPQFGANKIASVLLKYNYQAKIGDILAGTVVGVEKKQTLINLGLNQVAFLPNHEIFSNFIENPNQIFTVNKTGEFMILYCEKSKNLTILSMRNLHVLRLWERFKQIDFKNMILFGFIEKSIWSGKLINFDGLKIFLPNIHLPKYYRRTNKIDRILPIKILEVKDKPHSIIGSCRLAIVKKQSPSLQIGLVQFGCVLSVKTFGVFLNIYGIKCLLHISEISDKKIENIQELYQKGDQIKVKVIYINSSQGKIAVSAKQATN
jgi:small subunit ribosomal protein S1